MLLQWQARHGPRPSGMADVLATPKPDEGG
jgi:hypothetical protein